MINGESPYFFTQLGQAYLGDSLRLLPKIQSQSVDLICTSPPFALLRQKSYGNVHADKYIDWFLQFAEEFARILKPRGSLVIDIGGSWVKGRPVRSLYHFDMLLRLCRPRESGGLGFFLAQELYWYNPAKLPTPAEWVTVRRERVKDAVNTVWWLSLSEHPKANNRRVLKPYSDSQIKLMKYGYIAKKRPSEHDISKKFGKDNEGAIPANIINGREQGEGGIESLTVLPTNIVVAANTSSNDKYLRLCRERGIKPHPARFPKALPAFIISLCTEEGDIVLDPFAGSNMTGYVAEKMNRRWLAIEANEHYLSGASLRFFDDDAKGTYPPRSMKSQKVNARAVQDNFSTAGTFQAPPDRGRKKH